MGKNEDIIVRLRADNAELTKKLSQAEKQLAKFKKKAGGGSFFAGGVTKELTAFAGKMAGPIAGIMSFSAAMGRAMDVNMQFERSLADLSALTGATGKDLDALADAAIEMSRGSSMAASDIVDAMAKVGGAMPELLGFREGLVGVTDAAKTLSEATGMDMDQSIRSLTSMMNQFGAGAIQAKDYVNTLAAASQAGSAEVDYLAAAIERSAGAATMSGLSFEELVATIESVAPKFSSAEEAGTQLRNVLLRLETRMGRNSISAVGLRKSLEALARMSTADQIKIVGEETLRMAQAMQQARGTAEEMEQQIQGTNAAEEQAAIRTGTLSEATGRLSTEWDNFTLSLQKSTGPLAEVVDFLGDMLKAVTALVKGSESLEEVQQRLGSEQKKKGFDQANEYVRGEMEAARNRGVELSRDEARELAINRATRELERYRNEVRRLEREEQAYAEWERGKSRAFSENGTSGLAYLRAHPAPPLPRSRQIWDPGATPQPVSGWSFEKKPLPTVGERMSGVRKIRSGQWDKVIGARDKMLYEKHFAPELNVERLEGVLEGLRQDAASAAKAAQQARELSLPRSAAARRTTKATAEVRDPLAATRWDLAAAGVDTEALRRQMAAAEAARQKIAELDAALRSCSDPSTREKLEGMREELAKVAEYTEPKAEARTVVGGLDVTAIDAVRQRAEQLRQDMENLKELLRYAPEDEGLKQALEETTSAYNRLAHVEPPQQRASDSWAPARNQWEEEVQAIGRLREEVRLLQAQLATMDATEQAAARRRMAGLQAEAQMRQSQLYWNAAQTAAGAVSGVGGGLSALGLESLGESMQEVGGRIQAVIGAIQSVISVVQMVQALIGGGQIAAEAANTAATMANTAAIFSLIGTMGAMTAADAAGDFFGSLLGGIVGLAEGGVIGGRSWTGDKLLARVNSGEMVLTRRQQAALLDGVAQAGSGGGVTVVRGEDLYLSLTNYMRRTGKKF